MLRLKLGDCAKVNPDLTGLDRWVEGNVIDVEDNPFRGIVITIEDAEGRYFWGEEEYFVPVNNSKG